MDEIDGIEHNETFDEYIAVALTGAEVYGATVAECEERLREANRVWIEHCQKCREGKDGIQNSRA